MTKAAKEIQRTYITMSLLSTFAASFIWGINTLFLLDAGLSNSEAFIANAFFTVGMVLFEVPTGVIADTVGRRASYLLGAGTLLVATLSYLYLWQIEGPMWAWALSSITIGLGFTFFSGAVEAWLVDALEASGFKGAMENVFAKGQISSGIAMLSGSIIGGIVAQVTNLGVPFIMRAVMLAVVFAYAFFKMKDLGFEPKKGGSVKSEMKNILKASLKHGIKNRPVRWLMFAAPFSAGVGIYAFYAMQPYLLELYGDPEAYSVAGIAAAVVAGAQIAGGMLVPWVRKKFKRRTTILASTVLLSAIVLVLIGWTTSFLVAVVLLVIWAACFALSMPVRQAYINDLIPSAQRATVLSFDSLMSSSGGVVSQPLLGKSADVWSYSASYFISGAIMLMAFPFILLARRENAPTDIIKK